MSCYRMQIKQTGVGAGSKSLGTLGAATGATTLRRLAIKEYKISIYGGTIGDNLFHVLAAFYAGGHGTGVGTPIVAPLAQDGVASLATKGINHSAEPTYTDLGALDTVTCAHRGVIRQNNAPGQEWITAAVNGSGWGVTIKSGTFTGDGAYGQVEWEE